MLPQRKNLNIQQVDVKKPDSTIEHNVKWNCPVCGRKWFTVGEISTKTFHQQSQIYSPPRCPCYWIFGSKKGKNEVGTSTDKS